MKLFDATHALLSVGMMAAMLSGCGGSQAGPSTIPGGASGSQSKANKMSGSSGDLLYATGDYAGWVFSYPAGKLISQLQIPGFAAAACSDQQGNVFIPLYASMAPAKVVEYAHGGTTPIATLTEPGQTNDYSWGCSVDQSTGNLAVVNSQDGGGNIAIFQNAQGAPTYYEDPEFRFYQYCGYDNKGNLFIDGGGGGSSGLAELPKGSEAFVNLTVKTKHHALLLGNIQWDGAHLTVGDDTNLNIYRISVLGSVATVVGSTKLKGKRNNDTPAYWIQGNTVIEGANRRSYVIKFWHYPQGGSAYQTISGLGKTSVFGLTVSVAPPSSR